MSETHATARSRELGTELRKIRIEAGFNGIDMAQRLHWPQCKVSRLETGRGGASDVDVATYLTLAGVIGPAADRLVALSQEPDDGCVAIPHHDQLPDELKRLITCESTATSIVSYSSMFLPGVTQTQEYARAVFIEGGLLSLSEIELRVWARMDRQRLLYKPHGPRFRFFIHEQVMRIMVGTPAIMRAQLLHLAEINRRGNVMTQVILDKAGSRGALSAPFRFMRYKKDRPVVVVETEAASVFLEQPATIRTYDNIVSRLACAALSEQESQEVIARWANRYN